LFVGCGRLPSMRRWTTVVQSAKRHPTARSRRWQAFLSRPASGNPSRASHRREDLVSRKEPHVRSLRMCPEGARHISPGQGDASCASVAAALGSGSLRRKSPEGARQSMHRSVSPFQGWGIHRHRPPGRRYTLPRADLSRPLRDATPQPARARMLAGRPGPTASGVDTKRAPPIENANADRSDRSQRRRGGKDSPTELSAVSGFAHERHRSRGRRA
jgi:hypothetical protein